MKPGSYVTIQTQEGVKEGRLIPGDDDYYVLKLKHGYNIGIPKKSVLSIKQEKSPSSSPIRKSSKQQRKNLPTIAILHTGGTIASKIDYQTGGVFASYKADDFLDLFPEMQDIASVKTTLVENIMSEDMRFSHYQHLAKAIMSEAKNGVKGIIIGHGTDTLAYTSAALSFMLENIQIPVILVGAQRSSDRPSTDAALNMCCAAHFIVKTDFRGVALCMHEHMDDLSCVVLPA
ncbi:MAG: asparaginase domain-containing protein, partial [Nanoarchaeota archaeon]